MKLTNLEEEFLVTYLLPKSERKQFLYYSASNYSQAGNKCGFAGHPIYRTLKLEYSTRRF
jgi:hypothetical protein